MLMKLLKCFFFLTLGFLFFSPFVIRAQNNSTPKCGWELKWVYDYEWETQFNGFTGRLETQKVYKRVYKNVYECDSPMVENGPTSSSSSNLSVPSQAEKLLLVETLSAKAINLLHQAGDLETKAKFSKSQEKYCEAINILTTIIQTELDIKQYSIKAYLTRAGIKLGLKDYSGAIEDSSRAIQLSTPLKKSVMEIITISSNSKDPLEGANLLIELKGKNPEVSAAFDGLLQGYWLRATAKTELGNKTSACEDYRMLNGLEQIKKLPEFCN